MECIRTLAMIFSVLLMAGGFLLAVFAVLQAWRGTDALPAVQFVRMAVIFFFAPAMVALALADYLKVGFLPAWCG